MEPGKNRAKSNSEQSQSLSSNPLAGGILIKALGFSETLPGVHNRLFAAIARLR